VADAEARAMEVLRRNWQAVHETADALLEHETLSGVALDAVLSTVEPVALESLNGRRDAPREGPRAGED
jgi:cell division protease FtsH